MKFPKPLKITSRTSTITNAFVQAVIPFAQPSETELNLSLSHLGISPSNITCCYCGEKATGWDHLRPLVKNKKPTGFVSDYKNLVPCCAICNSSKGGYYWKEWINGSEKKSPRARRVVDLDERIHKLEQFEKWGQINPLAISELADEGPLNEYWEALDDIKLRMNKAQKQATLIREQIVDRLSRLKR